MNKKILIFGNTGFVGSWLSLALSLKKYKVLGISLKMKNRNYISNNILFKKKIPTIFANINNLENVKKKITKFKPNILIHLASQPIVTASYKKPFSTFNTNILGTVKILELAKKIKSLSKIIIFTSDKVYKINSGNYLNETSCLGGFDPYSASKSCQDIISQTYSNNFIKNKIIILRAGNIIGGGDWGNDRLIVDYFKSLKSKKDFYIKNPNSIRPWQHIYEVISFLIKIIKYKIKDKNNIFNLAPNKKNHVTCKNIISLLQRKNKKIKIIKIKKKNKNFKETSLLKISNSLVKKKLKWYPKINIKKAVNLTFEWYDNCYLKKNKDIFLFSIQQLKKNL